LNTEQAVKRVDGLTPAGVVEPQFFAALTKSFQSLENSCNNLLSYITRHI